MSEREDVEALVDLLVMTPMSDSHSYLGPVRATAAQILASDWLAARDEQVRASERVRLAGEVGSHPPGCQCRGMVGWGCGVRLTEEE